MCTPSGQWDRENLHRPVDRDASRPATGPLEGIRQGSPARGRYRVRCAQNSRRANGVQGVLRLLQEPAPAVRLGRCNEHALQAQGRLHAGDISNGRPVHARRDEGYGSWPTSLVAPYFHSHFRPRYIPLCFCCVFVFTGTHISLFF
jgi:hypothetical protein